MTREIVGVVGDAKQAVFGTDADPIYYFPYKQLPWRIGTIVLRTAVPPLEVAPAAREALASLDRAASMSQIRTGERLSAGVLAPVRLVTVLMGGFAAFALLLTVAGLYGVLSYIPRVRRSAPTQRRPLFESRQADHRTLVRSVRGDQAAHRPSLTRGPERR